MYIRNCPKCNEKIFYKYEQGLNRANKNQVLYKSCAIKKSKLNSQTIEKHKKASIGKNNPMYGKNIYDVWLEKYGKEIADEKQKQHKINSTRHGKNNGMSGKSVYSVWLEKYGKEVADEKEKQRKEKLSKASKGENNPMYGKATPQDSGNGWSGKYRDIHFRSILELNYLKYLLDNDIPFENGEKGKYRIPYLLDNGNKRTYATDYFLPENNQFIELKPKKLINTPMNKLKFGAAKELLGDRHVVITEEDIVQMSTDEMYILYTNGDLIWDKNYIEKFLNYYEKHKLK